MPIDAILVPIPSLGSGTAYTAYAHAHAGALFEVGQVGQVGAFDEAGQAGVSGQGRGCITCITRIACIAWIRGRDGDLTSRVTSAGSPNPSWLRRARGLAIGESHG